MWPVEFVGDLTRQKWQLWHLMALLVQLTTVVERTTFVGLKQQHLLVKDEVPVEPVPQVVARP